MTDQTTEELPRRSSLITIAGFGLSFAGFFVTAGALQTLSLFNLPEWWLSSWVYAQAILGVASVVVGFIYTQARGWSILAGLGLSGFLAVNGIGWIAYCYLHGFVSLVSLVTVVLGVLAFVMILISSPSVRRIHKAREELLADLKN